MHLESVVPLIVCILCTTEAINNCVCRGNKFVHFWTFNSGRVDFRGDCRYTLSEAMNTTDVCYFHIIVDNYRPFAVGGRSRVSSVDVIFGPEKIRVTLAGGRRVKVNDWETGAPTHFSITNQGEAMVIQTGLGLMFSWEVCGVMVTVDQDVNLVISLDAALQKNKVYGICGLCNDVGDDYFLKDGTSVQSYPPNVRSKAIADSFLVDDHVVGQYGKCTTVLTLPTCDVPSQDKVNSNDYCGKIRSLKQSFANCISLLPSQILDDLAEDCRQDVCSMSIYPQVQKEAACNVLQIMARLCAEYKLPVNWRNESFCPMNCPPQSSYIYYVNACLVTCGQYQTNYPYCATLPTTEGCVCDSGLMIDSGRMYCVEASGGCGCDVDNRYFPKWGFLIKGSNASVQICAGGQSLLPFTSQIPCVHSMEVCQLDSYGFGFCRCADGYQYSMLGNCEPEIACLEGSHYTTSLSTCRSTCRDPAAGSAVNCLATSRGCMCNDGYLWDEDKGKCVTNGDCGCLDNYGEKRELNQIWLSQDCSSRYRCELVFGLAMVTSEVWGCPQHASCDASGPQCVCDKFYLPVQNNDRICAFPIPCPVNGHYSPTASACVDTCVNPTASLNCSAPTYHGCKCNDGYYSADESVSSCVVCGCVDSSGVTHSSGSTTWNSDCTQLSRCYVTNMTFTFETTPKTCGNFAHCETNGYVSSCVCDTGYKDTLNTNAGDDCAPLLVCGVNSVYQVDATRCPATCLDPFAPSTCTLGKANACVCVSDYILSKPGGKCNPTANCSCMTEENFTLNVNVKAMNSNCTVVWLCTMTRTGPLIDAKPGRCGAFAECSPFDHNCRCLNTYKPLSSDSDVAFGGDCVPPIQCAASEVYDNQASACPSNCLQRSRESSCGALPVAGCRCKDTHWRQSSAPNATCIPKTECGCQLVNGSIVKIGDTWVLPNCTKERCINMNGVPVVAVDGSFCPAFTVCNNVTAKPQCVCQNTTSNNYIFVTDPDTGISRCQRETNICSAAQTQVFLPYDWREIPQVFLRNGDCTWTMMEVLDQTSRCYFSATLTAKTSPDDEFHWVDYVTVVVGINRRVVKMKWNFEVTLDDVPMLVRTGFKYFTVAPGEPQDLLVLSLSSNTLQLRWDACGEMRVQFRQIMQSRPTVYFRHLGLMWAGKVWGLCGNGNTIPWDEEYVTHGARFNVSELPRPLQWDFFQDTFRLGPHRPGCDLCRQGLIDLAAQLNFCGRLSNISAEYGTCIPAISTTLHEQFANTCEYAICDFNDRDKISMYFSMCQTYLRMNTECENNGEPVGYIPIFCDRCQCRRVNGSIYTGFDATEFTITDTGPIVVSEYINETNDCYYKMAVGFAFKSGIYQARTLYAVLTPKKYVVTVDSDLDFRIDNVALEVPVIDYMGSGINIYNTTTHAYITLSICKYQIYTNFIDFVISMDYGVAVDAKGLCGSCDGNPGDDYT